MNALLKQYITEVMSEIAASVRAPNQLLPKGRKNNKDKDDDKEKVSDSDYNEIDEMNVVGYTAPLGASSADMGEKPTKPGQKLKKHKKSFVRWK